MTRHFLNFLAALSLLLSVAACILWVRSYWHRDSIGWARNNFDDPHPVGSILVEEVTADLDYGKAVVRWWRYESHEWTGSIRNPGFWAESERTRGYAPDFPTETRLGCWLHRSVAGVDLHFADSRALRVWAVGVPLWMVAVAGAVLPAFRALAHGRRRKRSGLCRRCGYDLRATPGRCPECGAPSAAGAA